jgi:NADH dehydrogenase (ubiquinone) Fe-S protein 1
MFNIRINNNICIVTNPELTLLQQCELNSIYIPRFCYHDRLSIAGNCRMCLIELETSVKPIIACSTSVVPNMSVFTNSKTVKKIRENILEFLLINHPLDCPICDQGGECDLQDLSLVYGSDHGRFYDYKRNIEDKNCGVVVKTVMNRCILCTRCVRFATDVAGFNGFGLTGRGGKMEIGSYVEKILDSELSGNLIDVCPVGALTSKPYSFAARP